MTPDKFIADWKHKQLNESQGSHLHFIDLCELLGVDKPRDSENYCFEKGADKAGGGKGRA